MRAQKQAYIYALSTVLLWSTVATAFKLSLRYLDIFQLLFYAAFSSTIVLALILVILGRFHLIFTCTKQQYAQSIILGLMNPFVYYLILFKAYDLLPAQEAQPLNYTWAITLSLLSIPLLKQKISRWDLFGGAVSYMGVVVISTHGNILSFQFSNPTGVALALLSTVLWSLYWIYNIRDTRNPVVSLFLNFAFSLPVILITCMLFSDLSIHNNYGLYGAIYIGLIEMGITFVLWLSALKHAENTARVGNLIFLSPFLSLLFIHILVGETILPSTFTGLIFIILGLLLQQRKTKSG